MKVHVQYQQWSESSRRPLDYAMNERELIIDSISALPAVGDHVYFLTEADGEKGFYRVRSRLLGHATDPQSGEWRIYANVVLEEATNPTSPTRPILPPFWADFRRTAIAKRLIF